MAREPLTPSHHADLNVPLDVEKQFDHSQSETPVLGDDEKPFPGHDSRLNSSPPAPATTATTPSPPPPASLSSASPPPPSIAGPPPNGGTQAWLQVLGSFMLFFNTWGILNTFGVYQTYYESGQLFQQSSSNISWIGSIQSFTVLVVGAFVGPIYDRGHFKILLVAGTFMIVLGHMMLSLCDQFWQCLLAQGFAIGMGGGFLYVPSVSLLPTYFSSRIGLALGLAAAGSSLGGIIYPIIFYRLINVENLSFAWSVRILGLTSFATLMVPLSIMRMRVKPEKPRSIVDWTAFRDVTYMTFVLAMIMSYVGAYTGFFYTSFYGRQAGFTNKSLSFYLVPILNGSSFFGRTLPNMLSDKIGPTNVLIPSVLCLGIALLCMLAVQNAVGMVVAAIFFGFFSGVIVAIPPVIFVALVKDKSKVGTRVGMGFAFIGFGVLTGGPGAGAVLGKRSADLANYHPNWTGIWTFAGVFSLVGCCILTAARVMMGGKKIMVKV